MGSNMSAKHIIISGRVQGVGFRQYVFQEAKKLGLKGWVRNLLDGRVEVVVQLEGKFEAEFLQAVKKGPMFSQVTDVEIHDLNKEVEFKNFNIREDGGRPNAE